VQPSGSPVGTMNAAGPNGPSADILVEAARLADTGEEQGVVVRVLGGAAIALRCPTARLPALRREYRDIDVVARGRERRKLQSFLTSQGYRGLDELNAVHGGTRLFFYDDTNRRRLDVFLDRFQMCHELDLRDRLGLDRTTLPLADLLLTKLQVVETTDKDLRDIVALLSDHDLTEDERGINVTRIAGLTGSDWGLWRTVTQVTGRARDFTAQLGDFTTAADRLGRLLEVLDQAPKSRAWGLRARIGERVRWYKLPEEPDFG
jgi:hypothetical protein